MSRDAKAQDAAALALIDQEEQALHNDSNITPDLRAHGRAEMNLRREMITKVRYVHEDLDLDDPAFAHHNGIRVYNEQGDHFLITLDDLERTFKITIGIITVLAR